MTELRKELKARVQPEVKAAFERCARSRHMTESELLRTLVMAEIGQRSSLYEPAKLHLSSLNTERVTVRLAAFLRDAAKERARTGGMALGRWVAALVQANVTSLPVLTDAELAAVLATNRELAAIGRNINQIARNLNEGFQETERVKLEKLQELAAAIASERQAIRELVRASRQAWSGDMD